MCIKTLSNLEFAPDFFKTEELCNKAVVFIPPYKLELAPYDYFKTLMKQRIEMCNGITCYGLCLMFFDSIILRHKRCAIRQYAWIHTA